MPHSKMKRGRKSSKSSGQKSYTNKQKGGIKSRGGGTKRSY